MAVEATALRPLFKLPLVKIYFLMFYVLYLILVQIEKHFTSSSNNLTLPFNIVLQSGYVNSMAFAKSGKFLIAGVGQVFDPLLSVFLCSLFCVRMLI